MINMVSFMISGPMIRLRIIHVLTIYVMEVDTSPRKGEGKELGVNLVSAGTRRMWTGRMIKTNLRS